MTSIGSQDTRKEKSYPTAEAKEPVNKYRSRTTIDSNTGTSPASVGERLTRIETLLETNLKNLYKRQDQTCTELDEIKTLVKKIADAQLQTGFEVKQLKKEQENRRKTEQAMGLTLLGLIGERLINWLSG